MIGGSGLFLAGHTSGLLRVLVSHFELSFPPHHSFCHAGTSGRFELKERFLPMGGRGRGGGSYGGGRGGGGGGGYSLVLGDDEAPQRPAQQVRGVVRELCCCCYCC